MDITDSTYQIDYINFQPDEKVKLKIHEEVECLFDEAPSDATLRVAIHFSHQVYRIEFTLASKAKEIKQNVVGTDLLETMHQVYESVRDNLMDWKTHRHFNDEAADDNEHQLAMP